jgi:hypothetical protein
MRSDRSPVGLAALLDHLERSWAGMPAADLDVLMLELLVDGEEVLDLAKSVGYTTEANRNRPSTR